MRAPWRQAASRGTLYCIFIVLLLAVASWAQSEPPARTLMVVQDDGQSVTVVGNMFYTLNLSSGDHDGVLLKAPSGAETTMPWNQIKRVEIEEGQAREFGIAAKIVLTTGETIVVKLRYGNLRGRISSGETYNASIGELRSITPMPEIKK